MLIGLNRATILTLAEAALPAAVELVGAAHVQLIVSTPFLCPCPGCATLRPSPINYYNIIIWHSAVCARP